MVACMLQENMVTSTHQEKVNHHLKNRIYAGTNDLQPGLATMAKSLSYLLLNHFHWKTITLQRTLKGFNELPSAYLSGIDGLTKV